MKLSVMIGLAVYLCLALLVLTKDPVVFPDETSFATIALNLIEKQRFSDNIFSSQLPQVQLEDLAYHGPVYYLVLALVFKVFGFGLLSLRLSSVVIGVGVILAMVWLGRELGVDKRLSWLLGLLLVVDYNFLRMARFGRPEILVMLLAMLSFGYYLKLERDKSAKNYLILASLLVLGVLSHLALGWLAVAVIGVHVLITKNWQLLKTKKIIWPVILAIFCLGGWFIYSQMILRGMSRVSMAVGVRLSPTFRSIEAILTADLIVKTTFLLYGLLLMIFMLQRNKNNNEKFWSTVSLMMVIGVILGGVDWYLGLLTVPVYLSLELLLKRWQGIKEAWYNLAISIGCVLFFLNVFEQLRLNMYYSKYSYDSYSKEISEQLRQGAKVWMRPLIPDPMFYLIKNRQDLSLAYEEYFDYDQSRLKQYLEKADYMIVYGVNYQAIELAKTLEPEVAAELFKSLGLTQTLVDYLKLYQDQAVIIEGTRHYSPVAIYQQK